MTIEQTEKGNEILTEIKELKNYKAFMKGTYRHSAHFEFVEHYGQGRGEVQIDKRHNKLFIDIVDNIIIQLENQLINL